MKFNNNAENLDPVAKRYRNELRDYKITIARWSNSSPQAGSSPDGPTLNGLNIRGVVKICRKEKSNKNSYSPTDIAFQLSPGPVKVGASSVIPSPGKYLNFNGDFTDIIESGSAEFFTLVKDANGAILLKKES